MRRGSYQAVEFRNAPFVAVGGKWHLMLKDLMTLHLSPGLRLRSVLEYGKKACSRMSDERVTRESAELVAKIKYLSPHQKGTRPLR
jgi:hypothetical protein